MYWYEIIYSICVGAFFAGLTLTILLIILSTSNLISSSENDSIEGNEIENVELEDVSGPIEDINDGIDLEIDNSIQEVGFHSDSDIGEPDLDSIEILESEIENGMEISLGNNLDGSMEDIIYSSHVPLSLLFSLILLWFGAFGAIFYSFFNTKIVWIGLTCLLTWLICVGISKLWKKIAQNRQYRIFTGKELIGEEASIKVPTSNEGGILSVHTKTGVQQLHAKTLHPLSYFYPGDTVFIVDYKNGIYFVDADPKNIVHRFQKSTSLTKYNIKTHSQ